MRRFCILAGALALAACGPQAQTPDGVDDAKAPVEKPAVEGPARFYDPISKTAEAFTGALEVHDVSPAGPNATPSLKILTDNGHLYELNQISAQRGGDKIGATETMWATLMPIPEDADVAAESVTSELVNAKAPNGGLCKPEATKFLALATYKEDDGATMLQLAAFSDAQWPPKHGPALCGTFTYQLRAK